MGWKPLKRPHGASGTGNGRAPTRNDGGVPYRSAVANSTGPATSRAMPR